MKYISAVILVVFGIVAGSALLTLADHTTTYDTDTPLGSEDPKLTDDYFRDTKAALQERMDVDHYWYLSGTNTADGDEIGYHRKLTLPNEELTDVTAPVEGIADYGILYVKDVTGADEETDYAELHYMDEQNNEIQITAEGSLNEAEITQGTITQGDISIANTGSYSYSVDDTWEELEEVVMTMTTGSDVLVMFHATGHNIESSGKLKFRIQVTDTDGPTTTTLASGIMRINSYDTDTICMQALHTSVTAQEYTYEADYYVDDGEWERGSDYTMELTVIEFKK